MNLINFELINKKQLTEDVFELIFKPSEKKEIIPWQFVIFNIQKIDKIIKRAYSIADYNEKTSEITLLIKNIWYWSNLICCLNIWEKLSWMYPLWVFTLKKTDNNKLFLATGTWFAPIYYQAKSFLEKNNSQNKVLLLFWLRYEKDVFYKEKLEKLKQKYKNFDYKIFLSREMQTWYEYWYISSYLSKDNIKDFDEFYICWWPQVVKPIVEDLKEKSKENIFFESY